MNKKNWRVIIIIVLFVAISLAYSIIIPVFNAPDEPFHFEYIRYLAKTKSLPNQAREKEAISTEGFNPPLYYFINAIFLNLFSKDNASDIRINNFKDIARFYRNPSSRFRQEIYPPLNPNYVKWGRGRDKNMFLVTEEDRFPFSGSIAVIHLLRIIAILFGAFTVFFTFKTAQLLLPQNEDMAIIAVSLCALIPQFNFLSGSLNNDNLVILFSALSIWLLTKYILFEHDRQRIMVTFLGIFTGLGLITKRNICAVLPAIVIGITYKSLAGGTDTFKKRVKDLVINLCLFSMPIAAIAGWFSVRNIIIYGIKDPLGWGLRGIQNPGLLMQDKFRGLFFKKVFFKRLFTSFWGLFDWLTIPLPKWAYFIYGIISLSGILGLFVAFIKKGVHTKIKICSILYLVIISVAIANLIILNFTFISAQARLILPAITCFCIFFAMGIDSTIKYIAGLIKIKTDIFVNAFIIILLGLNLYALIFIIYPVYHP